MMQKTIMLWMVWAAVLFLLGSSANAADPNKPPAKKIHLAKVGRPAPDFEIPRLTFEEKTDGTVIGKVSEKKVKLSSFKGKKPVFLIFSSYT